MSGFRVPLTDLIPSRRIEKIKIDADLTARFKALMPAASKAFDELGDQFYRAFLEEVGKDALVDFLVRLSDPMGRVPPGRLERPIFSPIIGLDLSLEPGRDDPLKGAFWEVCKWVIGVLGGRWQPAQRDDGRLAFADDRARMPYWFIYSLLELARKYVAAEPDRASKPARARAFLRLDHVPAEWHAGRPWYATEEVFLSKLAWLRSSRESREEFLMRIIEDVIDAALGDLVPKAEQMDEYVVDIRLPYEGGHFRAGPERARECARVILGKPVPEGGSGKEVRDRLLVQLAFLLPDED